MRKCPIVNYFEYIATYVDGSALILKNPQFLLDELTLLPYNFKLKGSGPLKFHIGCGFTCNSTSTLCMGFGKCRDQIEEAYVQYL